MSRGSWALTAAAAAVMVLAATAPMLSDDEPHVDPYLQFLTAHLDIVPTEPPVDGTNARFARSISKITGIDDVDAALDACAGPVAVYLGDKRPLLVAEHDYCGGSAWMSKLKTDDVVRLTGRGVETGLYRTKSIKYVPRYGSTLEDMPDGDVVLQTCVSRSRMVLVALRFASYDHA